MSLLDGFFGTSMDDPKTMAALNLAAGLLGGGNFGQALGRGLGGYQTAMQSAKEAERQAKRDSMLEEQFQWKRDEMAREKAEKERQAKVQALVRSAFAPVSGAEAISMDASGPTPQKADLIGQKKPVDYQSLIAQGADPDMLKKLADAQNFGRSKVARTIKGIGPDGREYEYQVDEFGQKVGDGLAQFRAPLLQDLGGQVVALDPYKLTPQAQFQKSMSPDAQASNAVAWANNALSRERLNFDKQGGGKPQFNAEAGGFIYPPSPTNPQGSVVPLPGFQKPLNDVQAKAQLFGTRMQEADKVLSTLSSEGKNYSTPLANTPFIGGVVNPLNSEQGQMLDQAKRDFINAVLRRESGAAIAESEFDNANKQYFPQIGDGPAVIAQKARNRQLAVNGVLAEVPPGAKPIVVDDKPKSPKVPMVGQVVDGYKFKGGNPANPASWEKQ